MWLGRKLHLPLALYSLLDTVSSMFRPYQYYPSRRKSTAIRYCTIGLLFREKQHEIMRCTQMREYPAVKVRKIKESTYKLRRQVAEIWHTRCEYDQPTNQFFYEYWIVFSVRHLLPIWQSWIRTTNKENINKMASYWKTMRIQKISLNQFQAPNKSTRLLVLCNLHTREHIVLVPQLVWETIRYKWNSVQSLENHASCSGNHAFHHTVVQSWHRH